MARILFLMARRLNSVESGSKLDRGGDAGPDARELGVSSSSSSLEAGVQDGDKHIGDWAR